MTRGQWLDHFLRLAAACEREPVRPARPSLAWGRHIAFLHAALGAAISQCDLDEPMRRALLERRAAWRRLRRTALDECLALAPAVQTKPGVVVDLGARARARRCA